MNWTTIDNTTEAAEVAGAGCFVRFFNGSVPVFAPGVTIKKDSKGVSLVAAPICGTHISFTTDGKTASTGWIGDAGEKLDKKLAALAKKEGVKEPEVSITTFDTPYRGPAKVDRKKFKKMPLGKKKK